MSGMVNVSPVTKRRSSNTLSKYLRPSFALSASRRAHSTRWPVWGSIRGQFGAPTGSTVVKINADGIDHIGFGAPLHHMHERLLEGCTARQDRVSIQVIEVLSDCRALGDGRSVVELEDR